MGQTESNEISSIKDYLETLQSEQTELDRKLRQLSVTLDKNSRSILTLEQHDEAMRQSIDSLKTNSEELRQKQAKDHSDINSKLKNTNEIVVSNQSVVESRTVVGGIVAFVLLVALVMLALYLIKRLKQGSSSVDEVRKAQKALQSAQAKMQEDSIKLDNQILMLVEKQLNAAPTVASQAEKDHSLALKVADEIVRIELNLSRMDSSVKGYKQLSKAVERIKNNFQANGYEIVDMLGKPYNEGMKVVANFVPDDNLKEGEQVITGVIKPQINYNGKMIQSAQITVSQNI